LPVVICDHRMIHLLEPFLWNSNLEFYWPIVVQGAFVSTALALIGCFLVVRGMSLLGDALAHAVLPGIVVGFLITGSLQSPWILIGATATGVAAAVLIQWVQQHSRIKEDAALGIVFTTLFAIGVVLITRYAGNVHLDTRHVLYGNIEDFMMKPEAVWIMGVVLFGIVVGITLFYRHLLVTTFDPSLAISLGISAVTVHYVTMAVLSLTVVASFEAVGAILVLALLIMPGATARLLTDRLPVMLLLAVTHGLAATVIGYWLSHPAVMNTSASASIALAGFGMFLIAWLGSPRHGVLPRAWAVRRMQRTMAVENLLKTVREMGELSTPVPVMELAERMHVPRGQVERLVFFGKRRGWLDPAVGPPVLTSDGEARVDRLIRAHELWEEFLQREVGLDADHVHDAAEWIEHHLDEDRVEAIDQAMERPPRAS
jgi:manganese/zinc/iron transport system permease protein